jgi:MYXO-CTERM domain-containing protein
MTDLGVLSGGSYSVALGINNAGSVVGFANVSGGAQRAFLSFDGGPGTDLNGFLPSLSGWVLNVAYDINEAGQITGSGMNPLGQSHAFLLTPVKEPVPEASTWAALVAVALAGLWQVRRQHRG